MATGGSGGGSTTAEVTYVVDSDSIFPNPERGFYEHCETSSSSYDVLDSTSLADLRTSEAVTLILRLWYLDSFVDTDLSSDFLADMQADFDAVRAAGLKAILRFAYTASATSPYGDAPKSRVLGHIQQMASLLDANSDVIAAIQAGFVGAWGEWYYTDYFGDAGSIDATQWTDRQEVVTALLDAVGLDRAVQLRTPAFKQHFYGSTALTSPEAFSGTDPARVGHHNDCFLASEDDWGTYTDPVADRAYVAQESLYLPLGGETCAESAYSGWANAEQEMRGLHWSYLNRSYNQDVLGSWGTGLDIARRRLGYRLALTAGSFQTEAAPGSEFSFEIRIRNDGYAPAFNPRDLVLVLRNTVTAAVYTAVLPDDPRRFVPDAEFAISHPICLPSALPEGSYDLLLWLPDPVDALADRPEYAIRLANPGLWESATGYNFLDHTIAVSTSAPATPCGAQSITAGG